MNAISGYINMKKKLLSLVIIPILLTSCGQATLSLDQMREELSHVSDDSLYPKYRVVGSIDFNNQLIDVDATFGNDPMPDTFIPYSRYNDGFYLDTLDDSEAPENIVIYGMSSRSYWLRAPLRIHKSNFYREVNGVENTTCAHYIIEHIITSYYGLSGSANPSKNRMKMKINKDGDFIFYGNAVHTNVSIDNVPYYPDYDAHPELGGEWTPDEPLPCFRNIVNAKVNISFRYNKDGWLVEEKMSSIDYDYNVASTSQVSLRSYYGYLFG